MPLTPRPLAALAALSLAAVPVAACGSDDDSGGGGGSTQSQAASPKPLAFTVSGSGKAAKLEVPKTAEAGLVELTLDNGADKGDHSLQLVKITGDTPTDRVVAAANAWGDKGKPLPSYLEPAGGLGATKPGQTTKAVQVLDGGRYLILDFGQGGKPRTAEMEVTGSPSGEVPSGEGTITAREYAFEAQGLKTGKNRITFENAGKEPHHVVAAPLKKGATKADIVKAIKDESGPPPFDEKNTVDAAVLGGGQKQVVELDLKKAGDYALMCFIPDRAGGPPHVIKGMISTAKVQ